MSKYRAALFFLIGVSFLTGCFEAPEYSDVPVISFENVRYVQVDPGADSLVLSFNFTDGDGNIGLREDENLFPVHSTNVIIDSSAVFVRDEEIGITWVVDSTINYVKFGDETNAFPYYAIAEFEFPPLDPDGVYGGALVREFSARSFEMPPFNCKNYLLRQTTKPGDTTSTGDQIFKTDTILIEPNIFSNNIILDFYRKRGGQYENITDRFSASPCSEIFDSRIPVFDDENLGEPLVGTIHYPLISQGFEINFLNDSIMIEFYIFDRSFNKSNVVRTPDFTLPGLLKGN